MDATGDTRKVCCQGVNLSIVGRTRGWGWGQYFRRTRFWGPVTVRPAGGGTLRVRIREGGRIPPNIGHTAVNGNGQQHAPERRLEVQGGLRIVGAERAGGQRDWIVAREGDRKGPSQPDESRRKVHEAIMCGLCRLGNGLGMKQPGTRARTHTHRPIPCQKQKETGWRW